MGFEYLTVVIETVMKRGYFGNNFRLDHTIRSLFMNLPAAEKGIKSFIFEFN